MSEKQVFEIAYSDPLIIVSSSPSSFTIGNTNGLAGNAVRVRSVRFWAETTKDYWNRGNLVASLSSGLPGNLDTNSGLMSVGDTGKGLVTYGNTVAKNDGEWVIATVVDGDSVILKGPTFGFATVESTFPTRVTINNHETPFTFPRDIGKKIELYGVAVPNQGEFTIVSLLDVNNNVLTGTNTEFSTKAIVSGASFSTETAISWRLNPNFGTESNVKWEMAAGGSHSGTTIILEGIPAMGSPPGGYVSVMDIGYTSVGTGHLLESTSQANDPVGTYEPAYFENDPIATLRTLMEELTAAGVTLDVTV